MTRKSPDYSFDPEQYKKGLLHIFQDIKTTEDWSKNSLNKILKKYPKDGAGLYSKDELVRGYEWLMNENLIEESKDIKDKIKMKPTRTVSGVATVTVLTKPFPCPGECIFCPNDVRMPKSYLSDEPGAQRAERNNFDPYLQTYNRLQALKNIGHDISKVELIILGGTWSFYPTSYQIWFVKECFRALNEFDEANSVGIKPIELDENTSLENIERENKTYNELIEEIQINKGESLISQEERSNWEDLEAEHKVNETSEHRCVGLVIETRPDYIDEEEVIIIRKLGATKVQIGIQTLQDDVLLSNKRGHDSSATKNAIKSLRKAGFKIHAHWMPNLYKSTPEKDIDDYKKLWEPAVSPDELKIYPTSIIGNTELYEYYKKGKYHPYSYDELLHVLTSTMPLTPRFCRLTRIVRDIPSDDIVAGNRLTNFRQIAEKELEDTDNPCQCIRCREVKQQEVTEDSLEMEILKYESETSTEYFISYRTIEDDKIAGFLRLSLPFERENEHFIEELTNSAIIREVHVYGQVVAIGDTQEGKSQHLGLGTKLLVKAKEIAREKGFKTIAVISAIGTREYYKKKGFEQKELYMHSLTKA